ncbi:hypothetical protein NDU88_004780 [Pleurodeles waltl]|uniref:Uncharacterized protein n=1 Tax=Pleurodeles waltl TaxID=8319 RepID=A0AAV7M7A4_PLEWA|nr:hypothetical protein NDU88_004780 [Pleurodeles waltl]
MRGRTPMSKDNVGWLKAAKRVEWSPEEVKTNIEKAQDKYKKYYDDIHKCKEVKLGVGDVVRVKSNKHIIKGQSKFSCPMRVIAVYNNSARLDDGKVWHVSALSLCKSTRVVSETDSRTEMPRSHMWKEWLEEKNEGREDQCQHRVDSESTDDRNLPSNNLRSSNRSRDFSDLEGIGCRSERWSRFGRRIVKPKKLKDYCS